MQTSLFNKRQYHKTNKKDFVFHEIGYILSLIKKRKGCHHMKRYDRILVEY
jgi:hypothetical protein